MRKIISLLLTLGCFCIPALIVQYYNAFIDPMPPEDIRTATIAGTLGMIILTLFTGISGIGKRKVPNTPKIKTGKTPNLNKVPKAVKDRIITDPATNAQRIFHWNDKDKVWESDDGSILDESKLDDWENQRMKDREWADDEMKKLRERKTATDREVDKIIEDGKKEMAELEREQGIRERFAKHYGRSEMTEQEMREYVTQDKAKNEVNALEQIERANELDISVNRTEWTQWVADLGIDICDVLTLGQGRPIKNIYIISRNSAGDMLDCLVNRKNIGTSLLKSITKTVIDLTQANVNSIGYKYAANGAGDGIKGGLEAYEKGENVFWGTVKGGLKGTVRTGIEHGLSKVKVPKTAKTQEIMDKTTKKSLDILGKTQSGDLSTKVGNALRSKIRLDGALEIAAENSKIQGVLANGLGRLSDGMINML